MPGQAGTATAPGQQRISVATSPLDLPPGAVLDGAGLFSSPAPLRVIGLSGLSVNVDRTALPADPNTISVFVQIRIDSDGGDWRTLGIPCCCDPDVLKDIPQGAGDQVFVSWDHIAARQARVVITGTAGAEIGFVTLMATAT